MKGQLISVIIPVYNVEKYLAQCVTSVINQTYRNTEIILIDDGSEDNSGQICDTFAVKDSRIKVIHQENGGLSDARNAGMKVAVGDWILFLDSDDFMTTDCLEILIRAAQKKNADIVIGREKKFWNNDNCAVTERSGRYRVFNGEQAVEHYFYRTIPGYACGKLYKKSVLDTLIFPKGKLFEDAFTVYKFLNNAEIVVEIADVVWFYRQREGSIVHSKFTLSQLDIIEANREAEIYFKGASMQIKKAIISKRFVSAVDVLRKIPQSEFISKIKKIVLDEINFTKTAVLHDKKNSYLVRVLALIACMNLRLLRSVARMRDYIKTARI